MPPGWPAAELRRWVTTAFLEGTVSASPHVARCDCRTLVAVLAATAVAACASPAPDRSPAGAAPTTVEGCYRLALGDAAESEARTPVLLPAALALLPGGRLAGAGAHVDTLVAVEPSAGGEWQSRAPDSVLIGWHPSWLGGSLYLRLVGGGDSLRGRYEVHHHAVDDGRVLWRGDALALRTDCAERSRRLAGGAGLHVIERRLAAWRATRQPDTATAVTEGLRAFEAFLRQTPVHSLSLFNYRLAEYACWHGRVPRTIAELRGADRPPAAAALAPWEERSWRDAWGRPLRYRPRGTRGYEVRSLGADGAAGTGDDLVGAYDTVPLKRERKENCQ
jgi:Type II secretion system (T2SS), protein G